MNGMFLKLNFDFLDSGAAGAITQKTFGTFCALWRFVRRDNEESRRVVAVVAHRTLADTLGICERSIRYDLQRLKEAGWIKPMNSARSGQAQEWNIGYVAKGEDGKPTETLFAEEWCLQLRYMIEAITGQPLEKVPRIDRVSFGKTKLKVSREAYEERMARERALSAADNVIQLPGLAEKT